MIRDPVFERMAVDLSVEYALHPDEARRIVLRFGADEPKCKAIAQAARNFNVDAHTLLSLCK